MRYIVRNTYFLLIWCVFLFLPILALTETIDPITQIKAEGQLKVAVINRQFRPFVMIGEDGKWTGIDTELAEDIADKLGVKPVFIRTAESPEQLAEQVLSGEADIVISFAFRTLDLAEKILYTKPYLTTHYAILIDRQLLRHYDPTVPLQSLNNDEITFAEMINTASPGVAKKLFPNANHQTLGSRAEVVNALEKGTVDAVFFSLIVAKVYSYEYPHINIRFETIALDDEELTIAMMIAPENRRLLDWTNLYLESIEANGYLGALLDKYIDFPL